MAEVSTGDTAAFTAALESAFAETPADASPASTPAETTQTAEATAPAATTQAAEEPKAAESVSSDADPKGEPPKWRWQDILENARKEHDQLGYQRAKQEVEQQYGELGKLSADERAGLLVWNRALSGDPRALAQVAQINPALAQALGHSAQPQPDPEPQPDAAIQLADGSTVPVFTPEGMRKREAWLQKQLETSLSEKFQPLAQTAEQLKRQQEIAAQQQQTQQWAATLLRRASKLPHFEDHKPAIQKALAELPKDFSGDLEDVVFDTYAQLEAAKLTQLTKDGEAKALANLQQRAVAGTTNPNTAAASTPKKFGTKPEDFAAALEHYGA